MNDDIKKEPENTSGEHKKANFKKLKYGTMSIVLSIAVIAVIVLLNVILTLASDRIQLAADLTSTDFYELSDTTTDYLKTITDDVSIVVMADESIFGSSGEMYFKQAYEIIKNYGKANSHITTEFVDITSNPQYKTRYAQIYNGNINEGDVVVTSGSRITVFPFTDMFNLGSNSYGQQIITSSSAEQSVTSAVMYVTNKNPKRVYLMNVPTADESDVAKNIGSLLGNNGYDVFTWNPNNEPIPADADVLVITAPLSDFDENMINTFTTFLENGGKYSKNIVYLAHPGQTDMKNINSFLYDWGVGVDQTGYLTDNNMSNIASNDSIYALRTYINTVTSADFIAGVSNTAQPIIINRAMPIKLVGGGETGGTSVIPLLSTAASSYVLNDELIASLRADPNYIIPEAEYPVMTVSQKGYKSEYEGVTFSNVLLITSSDMLISGLTGATYYNNGSYFVSILNQMTGRSDTITIIPKTSGSLTFAPDAATTQNLTVVFYYVLPLAVAIIAAVVILRRRHK